MTELVIDTADGPIYKQIEELPDRTLRQLALAGSQEAIEELVKRRQAERE